MKVRHAVFGGACALLLALAAGGALADDLPAKKAGLWETKVKMTVPGMAKAHEMTTRTCVDSAAAQEKERADALAKAGMQCSKTEVRKTATGFVQDTVCKSGTGSTVTSHVEVTGDFNSGYKMKSTSRMEGKDSKPIDTSMEMESKWLGACPAGSTPGHVVSTK